MSAISSPSRRNLITIVSVLILIGTEVFGVALAAGWALAGIFELGDVIGGRLESVLLRVVEL